MSNLTLLEASKLVQDPLKKGVIEIFSRVSPVLARLPFFSVKGQAYRYNVEQTLPGVAFRGINESYSADTGVVNPQVEPVTILGGLRYTDRALVKTQGNINNLRSLYDGMKAKSVAKEFEKKFFSGNSATDPNEFDGLQQRLTGDQLIAMGSASGGDALSLSQLDVLLDQVVGGPDVIFCNKTIRRKINTLMRAAGQARETVSDSFGRQIPSYSGVEIAVVEDDKDGNAILGFTEANPGGGSDVGTSIYACKFGAAEYVSGLQAGDGIEIEDQGLVLTNYVTLIEFICGLGVFHPKSAARLYGIKNA